MNLIAYKTLQNASTMGGIDAPNLKNINRAILVERVAKVAKTERPWSGQLFYRLGTIIRHSVPETNSRRLQHTNKQTKVTAEIAATFRRLDKNISDWAKEDFTSSLRKRLHTDNEVKRRIDRNYENTWYQIRQLTQDRKRRDLSYLIAHMSTSSQNSSPPSECENR